MGWGRGRFIVASWSFHYILVSIKLEENEGVGDRNSLFAVHAPIAYKITRSEIRPYSL